MEYPNSFFDWFHDIPCYVSNVTHSDNESPSIYSFFSKKYAPGYFITRISIYPDVSTVYELLEKTAQISPHTDFYEKRVYENGAWQARYQFINRIQFIELRNKVGSYLCATTAKGNIGILSHNRIEWPIIQHACYAFGYIYVPIFDTFGPEKYFIHYNTY